jgi:uncharacterized phiE125 gp8 family phage protein
MSVRFYRVETAASVEPVTPAEVKLYARVAHSVEDSLITKWIKAARKLAEDYQHRSYTEQIYRMTYDNFPATPILFPRPPLISVESVKYYDEDDTEAAFSASNYFVDTNSEVGRLVLNAGISWPTVSLRPINGVIIDFKTGYGSDADAVPDSVKNAIYIYCTHMYENRESESGTIPREFYDLLRPDRIAIY